MSGSHLRLIASRMLRSLWFRPALYAILALAVLATAPFVAHLLPDGLMKLIGLSGVYDLLDALANTLLAVAIFSLGIMASSLHAASASTSPRVRPLLVEDSTARAAISTFIGGFVFAVVGIVGLSTGYYSDASKVLLFFVTCALLLGLIVTLIRWIARLSRLGGVAEAVDLVEAATRQSLRELAGDPLLGGAPVSARPRDGVPVLPGKPGFVQAVDTESLGCLAEEMRTDLHLLARPGAFVGPGRPLLLTLRTLSEEEESRLRAAFLVGGQRTYEKDPRFGLTVLSEIALRALSPAVNDPGTAIGVIATSTALLSDWAAQAAAACPSVRHPRLHVERLPVEDLVEDAFRWIARDGAAMLEVQLWVQKGLGMLVAQDEARFGPAARRLAAEALDRAETSLTLPADREALRLVAWIAHPA
ncbi:DUF2254 domain-containing protein [Rubellimicrobium roseum]|uniref:DUF2254 domain-containing protein n=1 Tax=Rubellimicrobium roseum TaxID=687525 RepID=A0A5C4N9K5_9RHOB|nr:DUF2254 domain-containing protein [Rubellimicrobium roseum]TNC66635.1 DUF2254 domain-containing protein [Rubellimicrobium roseum]